MRETWTMSFEAENTSANQPTITAAVIAVPGGPVLFDVNDFQRGLEDIGEYLQPDRGVRDAASNTNSAA